MLLREIKNIYHSELDAIYSKNEVDSFFYLVIEHYLKLERFALAFNPALVITKTEEQTLFEALALLRLQRPIQYILGCTRFFELDFKVNGNVLIPRPETEELVRWIIEDVSARDNGKINILDIGTGSGCIAIALAKNLLNAKVHALDISEKALEVAKENAAINAVEVEFWQADILKRTDLGVEFDIIVSNPPYVRMLEKNQMQSNVVDNEPQIALFVEDNDPLLFYRKIVEFAKTNLIDEGCLYFEFNQYLTQEIKTFLSEEDMVMELRKDIFGNDRMLKGRFKNSN